MKKKVVVIALAAAVVATISLGGTLAYFTDTDEQKSEIVAGKVDIDITEKTTDESAKIIKRKNNLVKSIIYNDILPGDEISKEPLVIVKSDSEDVYIRAKISIEGVGEDFSKEDGLKDELDKIKLNTEESGWTLSSDGYYYYNDIVESNENKNVNVPVFTKTFIPCEWDEKEVGKSFKVTIQAEAVQSETFEPVVNSENEIIGW